MNQPQSILHKAIPFDGGLLQPTIHEHANAILDLVNNNRQHLRVWLPWVDAMQTVDDFHAYITRCKTQAEEGTDYGYEIFLGDAMVGRIGIHYIHHHNRFGAIGYWLGEEHSGKGIITKACAALIRHCFSSLQLNRVEIKCAVDNTKSAAIPGRLGFTKEGILRQAELVNGRFHDLYLFSLLKSEWQK